MEKYRVIVDGYGGDNAPLEIVLGVVKAVNKIENLEVILTGQKKELELLLSVYDYEKEKIIVVDAPDIITNEEVPTVAIRQKTNSSLVKGLDLLKNDSSIGALVSAGSTGAILTGAFLKIGRIKGVSRPALSPLLPTLNGGNVLLIDCGANMDCKPLNLCHFALMGSVYMQNIFKIKKPRVALLNVGVEDKKGNELIKQTFPYLKQMPINFVGNIEARDFLSGNYDVVVADGFSGNVLLKSSEGAVNMVLKSLKAEIQKSLISKLGALFLKPAFNNLKKRLDYTKYGGSPLLGTKKLVIKSHGSSEAENIYQSIKQATEFIDSGFNAEVESAISKLDLKLEE